MVATEVPDARRGHRPRRCLVGANSKDSTMATKGLQRKAEAEGGQREGARMLLLDQEKCKPNMPAHT